MKERSIPTAMTIAGSDSGGGAGVQADLKVFNALGVHGTTAITCLTAQNPQMVRGVQATRPAIVCQQIEAVWEALPPNAIKTGMLYSANLIRAVTDTLPTRGCPPLVVDPVMVATSGARLLQPSAIRALQQRLLPRASLITPNLHEAAILTGRRLLNPEDLRQAARTLHGRFAAAILVKGGHLRGLQEAVDVFWDGQTELLLTAPRVRGVATHGTGCTYSAAITALLARGLTLREAVSGAKVYISTAIAASRRVAHHWVLGRGA